MTATLTRVDAEPASTATEPFVLTAEHLRALGACQYEQDRLRRAFPRGVALTEAMLVRHAPKWEIDWLVQRALNARGYERYADVRDEAHRRWADTMKHAYARYLGGIDRWDNEDVWQAAYTRYRRANVRAANRCGREVAAALARLLPDHASDRFVRIVRGGDRG